MPAGPRRGPFFALAWVTIVALNAYIIAPAPVFPELSASMGVGNAALGALISALLFTAILVQLPGAYLIDRWDNRRLVAACSLGLVAVTVPAYLYPSYPVVLATRLVAGLFVPLIFVTFANLVSHAYPESRVRVLGAYLAAPPAGYALGTFATPFLPPIGGLPFIFIAYALPIAACVPGVYLTSRGLGEQRGPMVPLRQYIAAFRSLELWKLGLAFAATYGMYIFFTSWIPSFLVEAGGYSLALAGILGALVPGLGIASRPLGAHLAETRFAGDKRWVLLLSFIALIPLSLVWTVSIPLPLIVLLLPLAGFLIQLPFSVYYAFSSQILPERLQGSAYTFMNTTSLIGGAGAPVLAGYLVDVTGTFGPAFLFSAAMAVAGLLLVVSSRER